MGQPRRTSHLEEDAPAVGPTHLDFVPIELVARAVVAVEPAHAPDVAPAADARPMLPQLIAKSDESWSERTSLFGEPEA